VPSNGPVGKQRRRGKKNSCRRGNRSNEEKDTIRGEGSELHCLSRRFTDKGAPEKTRRAGREGSNAVGNKEKLRGGGHGRQER